MVCEDSPYAHLLRDRHCVNLEHSRSLVPMHDINVLSDEYVSENGRKRGEKVGVRRLVIHHIQGQMVHFEAVGEVAHANSLIRKLPSQDHHVVTLFNQTLSHVKNVHFNAAQGRNEKVRYHRYAQLLLILRGLGLRK